MAHSPSGESLIERVVRILESFDAHSPVLTVSEIARRADLPVTTAHRLVNDLVDSRLLERSGPRGIHVGVRLWELSARSSGVIRLRDVALPFMEDLHSVVRQHTQLGVLDGEDVLSIERLSTPGSIINATHVAGRLPAHACSAGLVLLAYGPEAQRDALLSRPLEKYTANTVTDPAHLRAIFAGIRAKGHFVADRMTLPDAVGAAAPVFDGAGQVAAALTIVLPCTAERVVSHVPALMTAARGISRSLGVSASLMDSAQPASDPKFFAVQRNKRRSSL